LERHVRFASLDLSDVRPVQAGAVRQHVLGPTTFETESSHRRPKLPIEGSHHGQLGSRCR
jgi:hypothetical protein